MKTASVIASVFGLTTLLLQAVPGQINYQGHVADSTGTGLGTGTPLNRIMIFRLYATPTGGVPLWSEQQTVTLANGEFSVLLGTGIDASFGSSQRPSLLTVFGGEERYLELVVDNGDGTLNATDTPIAPRQRLTSAAYAIRAGMADSATSVATGSDLALRDSNHGLGWYGTGRQWSGQTIDGPVLYGFSGGALGSNQNGTQNTAIRWTSSGNVGIGNFAPTEKLDVTGNAKISGAITAGSLTSTGSLTAAGISSTGDITAAGAVGAAGFRLPTGTFPDGNFIGTPGNFIAFGHANTSEDFLGYKSNVFYFRDSPGGGDQSQPSIDVAGNVLAGGSITATSSLTGASISTSGNITASGSLTAGATTITGALTVNDKIAINGEKNLTLYDANHGLGYYGNVSTAKPTFENINVNGPVLFGFSGGALGSTAGGQRIALQWDSAKNVSVGGGVTANGNITAGGKSVVVGDEALRIVRGTVTNPYNLPSATTYASPANHIFNTNQTLVLKGAGYSFWKISSGRYRITFTNAFTDSPSFTFTPEGSVGGERVFTKVTSKSTNVIEIQVNNDDGESGNDIGFSFIAIGPR